MSVWRHAVRIKTRLKFPALLTVQKDLANLHICMFAGKDICTICCYSSKTS